MVTGVNGPLQLTGETRTKSQSPVAAFNPALAFASICGVNQWCINKDEIIFSFYIKKSKDIFHLLVQLSKCLLRLGLSQAAALEARTPCLPHGSHQLLLPPVPISRESADRGWTRTRHLTEGCRYPMWGLTECICLHPKGEAL